MKIQYTMVNVDLTSSPLHQQIGLFYALLAESLYIKVNSNKTNIFLSLSFPYFCTEMLAILLSSTLTSL